MAACCHAKDNFLEIKMQITVHNKTLDLSTPQVMGILNVTPDSFYAGSRKQTEQEIAERTNQIILEGGKIIDVGAFSTRPGSADVSEEEELLRMRNGLAIVRREQPDALVSIDTFRPSVARMAVEEFGADIINDISEGRGYYNNTANANAKVDVDVNEDKPSDILLEVARLQVPYILMSLQPDLENTVSVFLKKIKVLNSIGVKDIIFDPGFHNPSQWKHYMAATTLLYHNNEAPSILARLYPSKMQKNRRPLRCSGLPYEGGDSNVIHYLLQILSRNYV